MVMAQEELKKTIVEFAKTYEYSNLITIDGSGFPKGRMMENLPFGEDLIFWFATGAQSNKVAEIKKKLKSKCFSLQTRRPCQYLCCWKRGNRD